MSWEVLFPFAGLFAVFFALAFIVNYFGRDFGRTGASISAGVTWFGMVIMFVVVSDTSPTAVSRAFYAALLCAILISIVLIPILLAERLGWLRGRLVLGAIGALVAALVAPTLSLYFACNVAMDCL